jgi:hypothetical protein
MISFLFHLESCGSATCRKNYVIPYRTRSYANYGVIHPAMLSIRRRGDGVIIGLHASTDQVRLTSDKAIDSNCANQGEKSKERSDALNLT